MANTLINTNIAGKIAILNSYFAIKPKKRDSQLNDDVLSFFDKCYGAQSSHLFVQFASSEISEICSKSLQLRYDNKVYAEIIGEDIHYYTFWSGNKDCHNVGFTVTELGGIDNAKIYIQQMLHRLTDLEIENSKWQKSIRIRFLIVWGYGVPSEIQECMFDFFSQSQRSISNIQTTLNTFKSLHNKDINEVKFRLNIELLNNNHPSVKLVPV